ncbi:hypothetical protein LB505_003974 [Fusarium chuoi]|nr:hypothetical protein LB505_003974 [Fusarium chuoi]
MIFRSDRTFPSILRVRLQGIIQRGCSRAAFTTNDPDYSTQDNTCTLASHRIACSTTSQAGSWAGTKPPAKSSNTGPPKVSAINVLRHWKRLRFSTLHHSRQWLHAPDCDGTSGGAHVHQQ